jgi:hypothetical protein
MTLVEPSNIVVREMGFVVDVEIEEAGAYLLQTLTEFILMPSLEFSLPKTCSVIRRRDSATHATRRVIESTGARSKRPSRDITTIKHK